MKVYLNTYWDIDYHETGCNCGDCNLWGRSYGVALFDLRNLEDPVHVEYAPSQEAAIHNAKWECEQKGWEWTETLEEGK